VINIDQRIGSIVLILMVATIVLVAFNIYATLESADEAAELKEVLLAG
jgi:hypothetical protein